MKIFENTNKLPHFNIYHLLYISHIFFPGTLL